MIFLGIDPGKTGAIAAIDGKGKLIDLADMPIAGSEINVAGLVSLLSQWDEARMATVEKTQAMPAIPRSTAHSLGLSEGVAIGVIVGLYIPLRSVRPAIWKRAMNVSADKDEARSAALRLFPDGADSLARKKDHGRAEAMLLAEYGRRAWIGANA